jgi:hypothetical protein
MPLILPEKYQPKHARETVEVAVVPEPDGLGISKEKAVELAAQMRMYVLSNSMAGELETLAGQVDNIGANRSANGFTMMTQQFLSMAMLKLVDRLNTGGDPHEVAASLSKLANAMAKGNTLLKKGADEKARRSRPPLARFTPGQPVAASVTVNIQNNLTAKSE